MTIPRASMLPKRTAPQPPQGQPEPPNVFRQGVAKKPVAQPENSMHFYTKMIEEGGGNPSIEGMARSLAEAEHSLGIARQQRAMSDHIRARKAASGKYKQPNQ